MCQQEKREREWNENNKINVTDNHHYLRLLTGVTRLQSIRSTKQQPSIYGVYFGNTCCIFDTKFIKIQVTVTESYTHWTPLSACAYLHYYCSAQGTSTLLPSKQFLWKIVIELTWSVIPFEQELSAGVLTSTWDIDEGLGLKKSSSNIR